MNLRHERREEPRLLPPFTNCHVASNASGASNVSGKKSIGKSGCAGAASERASPSSTLPVSSRSVGSSSGQQHVLASNRSANLARHSSGALSMDVNASGGLSIDLDSSGALSMDVGSVGPSSRPVRSIPP
jgi:hypothetical protein